MPKKIKNNLTSLEQSGLPAGQAGVAHILFLIAALGIIAFLLASSTLPFKDRLFSELFPKPSSFAAEPGEIIIKFKLDVPDGEKEKILKENNLQTEAVIETKDTVEVVESTPVIEENTPESTASAIENVQGESVVKKQKKKLKIEKTRVKAGDRDKLIEKLRKNPNVEYAEPNYIGYSLFIPNDPKYVSGSQWDLPMIQAPNGWDITQGSSSVIVAFIDSGVRSTHEDLAGKIVTGYNFIDNNTDTTDVYGHGTVVAGRISATNNNKGIASLGWNTSIMPLRISDKNGLWNSSYLVAAIIRAADQPDVKVINISLGGPLETNQVKNAIDYAWGKGIVIVAAAGNNDSRCPAICYPAASNHVIAVGSLDSSGNKAIKSSMGPELDVMAPGAGVLSTKFGSNTAYGTGNGTSFSTPQVAALAALILSVKPGLNPKQVTDIITQTADDMDAVGRDNNTGWGRINALKALQRAQITNSEVLADSENPQVSISSPGNNANIKGTKTITASAIDLDTGIAKVEFYIDGKLSSSVFTAPYTFSWNTKTVSDGSHSIFAKAYDKAGNNTTSSTVNVTVDNTIPEISITAPTSGSSVSGVVTIAANASDTNLARVHFIIDGTLMLKDTSASYSYSWDTASLVNSSSHTIVAKAIDKAGNFKDASMTVTVNNQTALPTPTISPTPTASSSATPPPIP